MDLYGDVIVTIVSIMLCFGYLGVCIGIYKMGVVKLLDSIMYGG